MDPKYFAYYVLAAFSLIGNLYVAGALVRLGSQKSCFTFLLLLFHISLIGEEIATIPKIYTPSDNMCIAMEFFHFYFSLMNIVVLTLLVESHRSSLLEDFFRSRQRILKYGLYGIILFPLITVLPFTNGGYSLSEEDDNQGWCILSFSHDTTWELSVYFVWVWLLMILIVCLMAYLQYKLCRTDNLMAKNFFSTIGLYVIVGICTWIPRSFERMASYDGGNSSLVILFIAYLPVDISGIFYTLIFLREQRSLEKLNEFPEEVGDLSFTWEKSEIWDLIRNSQADALKASFASIGNMQLWGRSSSIAVPRASTASMVAPRSTISHVPNPIVASSRLVSVEREMVNYPSVA